MQRILIFYPQSIKDIIMRTKKGFIIVEQAIAAVPEFTSVVTKLSNQGLELADVIRRFGMQYLERHRLSGGKMKVIFNIMQCRTSPLVGTKNVVIVALRSVKGTTAVLTDIAQNACGSSKLYGSRS
jgi:hypothetical protein